MMYDIWSDEETEQRLLDGAAEASEFCGCFHIFIDLNRWF